MEIVIRASIIFFFLWLVVRATGKRELSQLTAFELILLVTIGDIVQQGVTQEDMSIIGAMIAVGTMTFWIIILSFLAWRFKRTRPVLEGVPLIIVREGQPLEQVLRVERVTLDELKESARSHGISDLGDIKLGVLEPDGQFSFITYDGSPTPDSTGKTGLR